MSYIEGQDQGQPREIRFPTGFPFSGFRAMKGEPNKKTQKKDTKAPSEDLGEAKNNFFGSKRRGKNHPKGSETPL